MPGPIIVLEGSERSTLSPERKRRLSPGKEEEEPSHQRQKRPQDASTSPQASAPASPPSAAAPSFPNAPGGSATLTKETSGDWPLSNQDEGRDNQAPQVIRQVAQDLSLEMVTASGGEPRIALREIRRVVEEKGGNTPTTRLIKQTYTSLDRLVDELYHLKAHTRTLETTLQDAKATICAKEEAFHAKLSCQEATHQQAIAELIAERDAAQGLLLQRDEDIAKATGETAEVREEATRLAHIVKQLEGILEQARAAISAKDMEIQAYRDQERDLRDQLQEAIKAQATAQAELAKSQDEALAASNFHFADYAVGLH